MRRFWNPKETFTTRNLAVMSMMLVLSMIFASFGTVKLTPSFKLFTIDYLPGVAVATLFGPLAAVVYGFAADTVLFFANGGGPYMPTYAISAAVSYLIYACLLHGKPNQIWRIAAARILSTILVTFGLNYLWNYLYFGSAASAYFTTVRLISNLINLPIAIVLIFFFNKLSLELYQRIILGRKISK